ncbi:MAG: c-type cytochrome [Litorivicinaceae bacterium]
MNRLITACVLICLSTLSWAHEGAEGVVKERMDRFKDNKAAMKAIKGNLGGDAAVIAQKASEIEAWAREMVNFFPEGSSQPPSEALPAIWEAFDHFTELANANATAAANLKTLAQSGADTNALTNGFKALGKTCKDCHNDYKE